MTGSPDLEGDERRGARSLLRRRGRRLLCCSPRRRLGAILAGQPNRDKNAPVVFQADEVEYDDQLGLTVAKGHVEISQGGEVLLADVVSYSQRTDTITASGHVSLLMPTGEVVFADFMELRDSLNNGFAQNVRMLMADRSRLVGNAARRLGGNRFELRRAVYSPCELCKKQPERAAVMAVQGARDHRRQGNQADRIPRCVLEIDGWPVFYTPYLSRPTHRSSAPAVS